MNGRVAKEPGSAEAILRHWRKAAPNDRLAHLIRDAARALVRGLQARLAAHSVSFGHWAFLRILWEQDGITQRELSEQAGVMDPTTFAALKVMEERGLIERRRSPDNRKKVFIHLTPRGRSLRRKLVPLAEEVNRVAVEGMPAADIAAVRRVLLAIIENMAHDEAGNGRARGSAAKRNGASRPLGAKRSRLR